MIDPDDAPVRRGCRSGAALVEVAVVGRLLECAAIAGLTIDLRPIRAMRGL